MKNQFIVPLNNEDWWIGQWDDLEAIKGPMWTLANGSEVNENAHYRNKWYEDCRLVFYRDSEGFWSIAGRLSDDTDVVTYEKESEE